MAIGGTSKSRKLLAHNRLQKRRSVRRVLLETLEPRQLLAVGPQLIGIQPNNGALLSDGEVLHISPGELVFRFNDGAGIDPTSLDGIRVLRSGEDGVFDRASIATDFGTGGQTLVEFYAETPGQAGNGIELRFTTASRTDSRIPIVRVSGHRIDVELNSNPALETRVSDLLQAFERNSGSTATNLVFALPLRGSQTIAIGRTTDTSRSLFLSGANAAKASTNFGMSNSLEVRFVARDSGSTGLGTTIHVTRQDRGGAGAPIISVSGKTINVELNSNPRFATTVREFVDALNASPAFSLIETHLASGSGATRIGSASVTYSPLQLTGVSDIEVLPAYVGLGDTDREVILRFAERLPQDNYRVEILGQGQRTLRNVNGEAFNAGVSSSIAFELKLGVQILSVVPQPVSRDPATGALRWARADEIDVYFTNDKLIDVQNIVSVNGLTVAQIKAERGGVLYLQNTDTIVFSSGSTQRGVLDPAYYQLINSKGTLDTSDDAAAITPTRIRYYPDADRVSLRFQRNLDEYADVGGELRFRVGTNEQQSLAPVKLDFTGPGDDPADTFAAAVNLNTLATPWTPGVSGASQSVLIDSRIQNQTPFLLDFPGGSDEPGNRQIRLQDHLRLGADSTDGISTVYYNFQGQLGSFLNAITDQQKVRVREVFSLYERYLGVRFVESANKGLTIGVGDMRAITPFPGALIESNQPGLTAFAAGTIGSNPATVLDSQDFASSTVNEFGGTFTRAAMQAIGQLLGLGDADDLEQLTVQSFASVFAPGVGTEIILPGDADIVHGQFLYRPDSKDIDLYQFTLPAATPGRMTIEVFAERMSSASLLDSHIRLFQEVDGGWREIAANDDYFSSDSYLELDLAPGNYIVGVSASGNNSYNPAIEDSGLGGRSQGNYQLRMDFRPPAPSVLRDADSIAGTEFDGNADGVPGGTFNFWFRPSNTATTKFVDKMAPHGGTGGINAPYKTIAAALSAAVPGDVVRIVGNGGADRNFATQADNLAYEIGFDSLGRPLPDGTTLDVPKDVTVVIDAGAILKLRRARVGVGSTSVTVDRSGGSLMVLGTPTLQTADGQVLKNAAGEPIAGSVFMTSLNDTSLGAISPAASGPAAAGDWGGIDFRRRVDLANGRENLEKQGIFVNWVSNAEIRYGGGQVVIDGVSQAIAPVQMIDARPSITHNIIANSADSAMSATPDSFAETNFHSPQEQAGSAAFTVDYNRVGPDIRGNRLVNNSINGLQVRVRTSSSTQLEKMTVQGRFDDTDIVHYIPENLQIQGSPGGAIEPTGTSQIVSRLDARLVIDPGTIIKSRGSRVELEFGAQLIAEGTAEKPIIFTSLADVTRGAGGTFVTASGVETPALGPGNWGGIYVGHTSSASLDHVVIAYGGGETRIEGGFADFGAIEVHQGNLRLANSRIENNADGTSIVGSSQRAGRGNNAAGAIFVRGAQPIIVNNIIQNNQGPAITANVSSLNNTVVDDLGRSRGELERFDRQGNQGPLIRSNLLTGNDINGLVVRGAKPTPTAQDPTQLSGDILTTEGVWDDTDIVHVVLDQIVVPDFHAFGGLSLKSSSSESLVVKLRSTNATGDIAGITATGRRLDNANRIGGSVHLIGTPSHPVILTALTDSSVGAGFTPSGDPQLQTVASTTNPIRGSWRGILLDPNSNDRNVAMITEFESAEASSPNSNGTPSTAQFLGGLAPNESSGDENRRLGFVIQGAISSPTDEDVYSFEAEAGTEVWLDIDRTNNSLDTIIELIDANGRTLARSVNSLAEEADPSLLFVDGLPPESVNPLRLSTPELYFTSATGAPKDLYSTNPRDAGFRVRLPGALGASGLYHVRVRSQGDTQGVYQLQIRLNEVDELPGSSFNYADIRFAQTGIQLIGLPTNSPLLGENGEVENRPGGNNTFSTNAQALGNLLQTNRQAISVAGNLDSVTDVDWFSFDIQYQRIRPTTIRQYFATVFDVDYADGLGRPDTSLYVFDSRGYLILGGLGSNLVDDQASPLTGAGNADLSRGSAGTLDPYVDSFELPAGRYYLAVTNSSRMPQDMTQFTVANTTNPLVRLQPIESVQLIAEDHVASNGGSTAAGPIVPDLFVGNAAAVPWNLGDIMLYVSRDAGAQTDLFAVNPFTGQTAINFNNRQNFDVEDIAFRDNGQLRAFDRALIGAQPADLDIAIDYININTGTGAFTATGATGLQTFHVELSAAVPPVAAGVDSNDGIHPEAITFANIGNQEYGFFVGNRNPSPAALPNVGTARPGPAYTTNLLYEFNEDTGAASGAAKAGVLQGQGAGTTITERGYIETAAPAGTLATALIAREVTRTQTGQRVNVINDGNTFTVVDRTGVPINRVFEFDLGPEVIVNYNPATNGIRDGMQFTLNGVSYEFDTGSVVIIEAESGSGMAQGSTVTIRNSVGISKVFEFDSNHSLSLPSNVQVPFTVGSSQAALVRALVTAVNSDRSFGVRAEVVTGSNRVSFVGVSTVDPVVVSGLGLAVTGSPGVTGGVRIAVSEAATESQLISAISSAMPVGIAASYEAGRLNFPGAASANFGNLASAGIFNVVRTTSGVGTGRIPVNVQVSDSAETVARRIIGAVNGLGIAGLSAALDATDPQRVNFFGASLGTAGPLTTAGVAPGGMVTGIAVIGSTLFAVSDQGGLYSVPNPQTARPGPVVGNVATYVSSAYDLRGIRFTGLTAGPTEVSLTGGVRVLFGIDSNGVIHAFDTSGRLQPVFANGANQVATGLSGANGLALSPLQSNLWSMTTTADNTNRETNAGHGMLATPNGSRGAAAGGVSYYFGDNTAVNYNFPGGAAGALESTTFSLAGLSAADMPMLYFNYFIDTEHTNNANNNNPVTNGANMRDAFRVYASGEDGNWILLATNNTDTNAARELAISPDVQPLFNRSDSWRQARIPLDRLAGQENIKLRVEFSTGGGFGYGRQGGQGPEIRTTSADRLVDGQTLTINGRQFELDFGPTLTLPSRSSLSNGQSLTIDGIRYVFTDGTGPAVVAPDVAVILSPSIATADEVAAALSAAITSSTPLVPVVGGLTFLENNDVISRANHTGIRGETILATGTGTIGDRLTNPDQDVDMVRVDLMAGSQLAVNANTSAIGSPLNSYLRLFDNAGRELARSSVTGGDSQISFTASRDGAYFIGISGAGNQNYDAVIPGFTTPGSTGNYELQVRVTQPLTPVLSGNRLQLQGASVVSVAPDTPIRLQGETGTDGIPVRLTANMSAAQVATALRQAIADTFANARAEIYTLRGGDTLNLTGLTVANSGPFGLTTQFPGESRSTTFNSPLRAQSNNSEGVYVDDFIIGIAGRGEMVLQPRAAGTGVAGNTTFVANPKATTQILTGPYQFEVRGGQEYGVPTATGIRLRETFPLNERTSPGLSIRFHAASRLVAGETFTVGDGPRVVTFELDDVNDGRSVAPGNVALTFNTSVPTASGGTTSESAQTIAARFRDLLNSSEIQSRIGVVGNLVNNDRIGATSDTVVLIGNAIADIPSSVGEKIVSTRTGGGNRVRPQGQIIVNGVRVSDSSDFGISVAASPRDPVTGAPLSGVPRNTIVLNTEQLTVGAVIMNSELLFNTAGGINITGDAQLTSTTVPGGSRAFVRLINNTIVGGSVSSNETFSAGGTGIRLATNATATLLNNVVVNSATGINVDASSSSTVIGGTVFHRNTNDTGGVATRGQFPIPATPSSPSNVRIFQDIANRNLYPAAGSPVIDSSIDSLQDRPSLVAVKQPLGLSASPILSPRLDIKGQLRVDDPSVKTPAGLGESVFKDRGAQDRADFSGPTVVLLNPADNDFAGLDLNPRESIVELRGAILSHFDIQIVDGLEPGDPGSGSGVDTRTVTSTSVLVYGPKVVGGMRQQNQPLVEGRDYRFGYDATNGIIRLTPLAGIWEPESVYTVRFLNSAASAITAQADYADGEQLGVVDPSGQRTTFEIDLGYVINIPTPPANLASLEGRIFILDDGSRRETFEFDLDGVVANGNRPVAISSVTTAESLGRSIESAIRNATLNLTVTEIGPGQLQIQGSRLVSFNPLNSGLTAVGRPGVQTEFGLQIPLQAGKPSGLEDGQTFSITRAGSPVTFELNTNGGVQAGNQAVNFATNASVDQIAAAIIAAINSAAIGLTPVNRGNGLIALGGDVNTSINVSQTALMQTGLAGQAAAVRIAASAAAGQTADDWAAVIKQAIDAQNLPGVTTTQFGNRMLLEGANSTGGVGSSSIAPIRDLAGNLVKANQTNGTTSVSIFLGEGFDYGDAPAPYRSTNADNGPRHRVIEGLSLGPTVTVDADAKLPNLDEDDNGQDVSFSALFASFNASATVHVTNTTGRNAYVTMWIDWDGNGIFAESEKVVSSHLITDPTTTFTFSIGKSTADQSSPNPTKLGNTYARVRLSSDPVAIASPLGIAPDGEVEDFLLTIQANPFHNASGVVDQFGNGLDVSGDGFVSPIDVLQVINWINDSSINPVTGRPNKPNTLQLSNRTGAPPFVDVNGDGLVSALDVNLLITYLNSQPLLGSGEGEASVSLADLGSLGGGQSIVLSSDWASGLESLHSRRVAERTPMSTQDQALLQSEKERAEAAIAAISEVGGTSLYDFWASLSSEFDEEDSLEGSLTNSWIDDLTSELL